ncbi:hypothetical protein VTN96DRAFT_4087 [Rasamsonia emersonii]|uniref:DUF1680 domain protein n=1 Tax=Rasamsonia emersonii (strain ATCC 16479 / CBS 393.64 / IMI 116815) TaxID=1408163 RepID=A0A0F4YWY1_RASE3|nr:hypothetical protein T310_3233 [Rasamsonia emersonii CBS 393.64]KKA22729.1 hypothetical protein T310_3233 [Rasamsonia emersonii CBS 393.64]
MSAYPLSAWRHQAGTVAVLLSALFAGVSHGSPGLSLLPRVLEPLPLGSIKPQGWLKDQLQLMSDGLAGHEHEFYGYVRSNPWLGGDQEYSSLNEAFPYWFNGLVPLAYGLDDQRLKDQVLSSADYILSHQQSDGWLGPETNLSTRNFWARYPAFLGLAQLAEAENGTDVERRILDGMHRFVNLMHSMLADNYTGYVVHPGDDFDDQWGRSRAADMILGLQWLFEKDPRNDSQILFECMQYLNQKAYNWSYWYTEGVYIKQDLDTVPVNITNFYFPFEHGVNVGQGLKAGAVIRRFTFDDSLADSSRRAVNWTFQYHGTPSGVIIADERLSGLSPVRGVELCCVVETMYSLSYLYQALGDAYFADRCELAAYNALPVMLTPNWWAHQYVAETNQPISHQLAVSPFWNVNTVGQTFGLEPNYPCCTVNHPQGYPKFVSNSFVRVDEDGIAHALLGPTSVNTTTKSGRRVNIACTTDYPFSYDLTYSVQTDGPFDFFVRVPSWASTSNSVIAVNGGSPRPVQADPATGLHRISLDGGISTVVYSLSTDIRVEQRANDTVSIYHGALLYSVPIGENVTTHSSNYPGAPPEVQEYTMLPTTKWALAIDPSTLRFNASQNNGSLPNPIWTLNAPPVTITATVCEISWDLVNGYAPNPPLPGQRNCTGDPFEIALVPYGSAKLHMAELPTVSLR